ncbi:MAG: UxaA family hydrolase, partial [Rhizobacter sp.]|nr:UxaA family hydrolase [Rhizobacter sp.]
LVECAHHVARDVMQSFRDQDGTPVHLIGFPGCYPNAYADRVMRKLVTHPNVGAVLLVSLGCESFDKRGLEDVVRASGRPVHTLTIQRNGGTRSTIDAGILWVQEARSVLIQQSRVPMGWDELVVATVCGGSDGTSGITANPAVGRAFDTLVERGATCIFEETGELVGCETHMADRAARPELGAQIVQAVQKAERYYRVLGHGSFAPGNAAGGLTTQEEKSLGAYAKSGASAIVGLIKPGDAAPTGGLYLLDVVPDGEVRFGFPNISDTAEVVELMSCGAHLTLFTTGRGSVVGSAISPVIKVCANAQTYEMMHEDMDINAGRILSGEADLDDVGREIVELIGAVANGGLSKSEELGHQEFLLTYKSFEPLGPGCLPV